MRKTTAIRAHIINITLVAALMIFCTAAETAAQAILAGDRSVPVEAQNGMVVTSHTLATQVALDILKKGGNAIDAAVTAGFALALALALEK